METTKKSAQNSKIGQNLQPVQGVENATTTRGKVKKGNVDYSRIEKFSPVPSIMDAAYEALSAVELQTPIRTIPMQELTNKTPDDVMNTIKEYKTKNEAILADNKKALRESFFVWLKSYAFPSYEEKQLFVKRLRTVRDYTENFTLTFQNERTVETNNTYEGGAFFARPTTITASGIRTCFNSLTCVLPALKAAEAKQKIQETIAAIAEKTNQPIEVVAAFSVDKIKAFAILLGC